LELLQSNITYTAGGKVYMSDLLKNKNIVIMGVRNKWSIAWAIAAAAHREGASLVLTYLGEREKKDVEALAEELGGADTCQLDVSSDTDIDNFFESVKRKYGAIHGLVHAIAYARAEDLQGRFVDTSREGFALAMDISVYSLAAVSRRAAEAMVEGGSIVTLTYMGSEKVMPGYNVMGLAKAALEAGVRYLAEDLGPSGIRVNAISAGAVKTLSAKGIKDFSSILKYTRQKAPLRKNVEQEEIGDAAVFLLSEMSKAITGEVLHVDCGVNIIGV
jgi:enoyl-[acyl-carrier protein] reductase I